MFEASLPKWATAGPVWDSVGRRLWEMHSLSCCGSPVAQCTSRGVANGGGDGRFERLVATSLVSRKGVRLLLACLSSGFAAATVPAHADVLEVSRGKSEWIASGSAMADQRMTPQQSDGSATPSAALAVPAFNPDMIPQAYAVKVQELAARYDLSPALIEAVVWQESRWRAEARSAAGARGLAQLMPETARYLGVDPDDPLANLEGGARYLRELLNRFGGDLEKALAAYNAGPGRVQQAGGVPRIRETQTYVAAVLGRLSDHTRR